MTRLGILFLAVLALATPPAVAKGGGRRTPSAATETRKPPAESAEGAAAKAELDKLCENKESPFKDLKPVPPTNLKELALEEGKPMKDEDEAKMKFDDVHCKQSAASEADKALCYKSYAWAYRGVLDGGLILKDTLAKVCEKIKQIPTQCTDQATAQKCAADVYKGAAAELKTATTWLGKVAGALDDVQNKHVAKAKENKSKMAVPGAEKYVATASLKAPKTRMTESVITGCEKPEQSAFCEHLGAAADSGFFSGQFRVQVKEKGDLAAKFEKAGEKAAANNENSGPDKSGVSGKSGMGLDDMIKMATLGLTGAALYCSISKSCSPSNDAAQSAATSSTGSGATSPTPDATNPGDGNKTETSSLGNSSLGGTAAPGSSSTGTAPQASTAATSYHSPGFSGGADSLSHFNGELGSRAPAAASSGAVGGGSSGGGGSGGGTLGTGDTAATAASQKAPGSDGIGSAPGGGGLMGGGAGGFSLGDKGGSPADAALKNILNGDLPTSTDTSVAPLDGAGTTAAGNDGQADPENLFVRVKDTHVRCLKRGCVGAGVGSNI